MTNNNNETTLLELYNSGYEIADGEPDIRGWVVRNLEGRSLGTVHELLFDPAAEKVRYLVIDLKAKGLNLVDRKIIIPIGIAEIHEIGDDIILPTITIEHLATLPDYRKGKLDINTERNIRKILTGTPAAELAGESEHFYQHTHFDNEPFYKNRRRQTETGSSSSGNLKRSAVSQDDINRPFQKGSIEIVEKGEVPVVTKEARVVEEVSLNKETSERDETVKDTVRNTEVDVEKWSNDSNK